MNRLVLLSMLISFSSGSVPEIRHPLLQGRIAGGEPADIEDNPYQVSLEIKNKTFHFCGGSILDTNTVLTAAHCVDEVSYPLQIRAGTSFKEKGGSVHPISKIIVHSQFHGIQGADYDVAVIKVSKPFKYNDSVQPISLATLSPPAGSPVAVTGWGITTEGGLAPDQLQKLEVQIVDHGVCNKAYNGSVTPRMICAGIPEDGKGTCRRDSGGPLVYNRQLVGVVSWGAGCGEKGYPGVYADVASVRDWILNNSSLK